MSRGFTAKYINEYFFDKESKAMWYVLGAFYDSYIPKGDFNFEFRSQHKDLVQIVKDQLESEHTIMSDPRGKSSHWITAKNTPYLRKRLEELGLNVPKSERRFPEDIKEQHIDHFVRGFLDAQGRVAYNSKTNLTRIEIEFNHLFLVALNQALVEEAHVQRDEPPGELVTYGHDNSIRIHSFIYRDRDFIQESGLYLPSKKAIYVLERPIKDSPHPKTIESQERIEHAKELLLEGKSGLEVAEVVGYTTPVGFYNAFKRITGKTIRQFLRDTAQAA